MSSCPKICDDKAENIPNKGAHFQYTHTDLNIMLFKASAHSIKRFTLPPFFFQIIILFMHLLPRMNVMLDFI